MKEYLGLVEYSSDDLKQIEKETKKLYKKHRNNFYVVKNVFKNDGKYFLICINVLNKKEIPIELDGLTFDDFDDEMNFVLNTKGKVLILTEQGIKELNFIESNIIYNIFLRKHSIDFNDLIYFN